MINEELDFIKTYLGVYRRNKIYLDNGEEISVRPYASKVKSFENKRGYFNVKFDNDFGYGVIIDAIVLEDENNVGAPTE